MTRLIVATLATAAALAPSPVKPAQSVIARRDVGATLGAFAAAVALPAFADDAPAAPPAEAEAPAPVEFPKDWGITSDYYTDAAKVVRHMRIATSMDKNYPNMEVSRGGRRRQLRRAPLPHPLLLAHAGGSPRVRRLSART